jgi:hypothetical protein
METERNGVRVGLRVRDLDGKDLGKVTELYEWGFAVEKGFPVLFRRDTVATYDEVRGIDRGVVTLARNDAALLELADGEVPRIWRIPVPHEYPGAATPGEARAIVEAIAAAPRSAPARAAEQASAPVTPGEEREYEHARGQDRPAELGGAADRAAPL